MQAGASLTTWAFWHRMNRYWLEIIFVHELARLRFAKIGGNFVAGGLYTFVKDNFNIPSASSS